MADESPTKAEGLISLTDYLKGWLPLVWRLPAILYAQKQLANVGTENRESWGSMLEENAEKYPHNPAVKSEEAFISYRNYNAAVNRCANYFVSKRMEKDTLFDKLANLSAFFWGGVNTRRFYGCAGEGQLNVAL